MPVTQVSVRTLCASKYTGHKRPSVDPIELLKKSTRLMLKELMCVFMKQICSFVGMCMTIVRHELIVDCNLGE